MSKLTMKEIAALAGVSPTTVSRVFHSPGKVNEETLEKIRKITEEHNYIYNAAAGSLSSRHSRVIGALLPRANRSFFSESLIAIQDRASEHDYSVISGNTNYDSKTERQILQRFRQYQISGLIVAGYNKSNLDLLESISASGVPVVVIWEEDERPDFSNAGFDNFRAAYRVTEHLISLGHRRIGLISGPIAGINRVNKRRDGFKAALGAGGLDFHEDITAECEPVLGEGRKALRKIMTVQRPPTAIFAASDTLALGAMAGARELGLKVPRDLSIAGFDDIDLAAYSNPPLTTVRVPAWEMGARAVDLIIGSEKSCCSLETELIIRESCSAPQHAAVK